MVVRSDLTSLKINRISKSALGHNRTFAVQNVMSALPPIPDMCSAPAHVRFVPIADIVEASARCPLCPNKQTLCGIVGLSGKGTS